MVDKVHLVKRLLLQLPSLVLNKDVVHSLPFLDCEERACVLLDVALAGEEALVVIPRVEPAFDDREYLSPDHGT